MTIKLQNNQNDLTILVQYLNEVDGDFLIPLSKKTDLESFASKILTYGHAYMEKQNDEFIGLVTFYCNDVKNRNAYIPIVSIKEKARGRGLSKKLTYMAIETCRSYGMKKVFVDTVNPIAGILYRSLGFEVYKSEKNELGSKEYFELTL